MIDRITKSFPGQVALRDVSMDAASGQIRGLLGANGSGKSTLVKILAGVEAPNGSSGGVSIDDSALELPITPASARKAGLRFVHQDLGLIDRRPVLENLIFGRPFLRRRGRIDWKRERALAQVVLDRFDTGFQLDQLVGELSRADQTMVAVARAFASTPDEVVRALVLDEPTVGLPRSEVERLWRMVRTVASHGVAVVAVTHSIDDVESECDNVTVLRDGQVVLDGSVAGLDRAEIVTAIAGRSEKGAPTRTIRPRSRDGHPLLDVRGLRTDQLAGIDVTARPGEVVGFVGGLGSGTTQVMPALYGDVASTWDHYTVAGTAVGSGDVGAMRRAAVAYVPSKRTTEACFPGMSLCDNLTGADLMPFRRRCRLVNRLQISAARDLIAQFSIAPAIVDRPIEMFSGGNQQKAVLARWLWTNPRVLLLDEPTQGIDVGARSQVHRHIERIAGEGTAVLVVSSDEDELATLCDRVMVCQHGQVTHELAGEELTASAITHKMFETAATKGP